MLQQSIASSHMPNRQRSSALVKTLSACSTGLNPCPSPAHLLAMEIAAADADRREQLGPLPRGCGRGDAFRARSSAALRLRMSRKLANPDAQNYNPARTDLRGSGHGSGQGSGHGSARADMPLGNIAVAVPIKDQSGRTLAALAIEGPDVGFRSRPREERPAFAARIRARRAPRPRQIAATPRGTPPLLGPGDQL